MDNNFKPENKNIISKFLSAIGTIILVCGVAFFGFMFIGGLITGAYLSSVILFAIMIFLIPPIYHKIPRFKGKCIASTIFVIVGFVTAMLFIEPASPLIEEDEPINAGLEKEESINEEVREDEGIESVKESKQPRIEAVREEPPAVKGKEEKAETSPEVEKEEDDGRIEYREYMDSLSLQDWITENIEEGKQGSEYDWEGIKTRKAKLTEKKFYKEWCSSVKGSLEYAYSGSLKEFNSNGSNYELEEYCKFLESAVLFFDAVYPDNDLVDSEIKPLFEEAISSANDVINCANTVSTYPSETFYVSNKYAEKGSTTMWVAYGTYYDSTFETQMTDADSGPKAILRTSISYPFPASNKYVIEYQDSGETKEVESESGFSSVIPIYDIVSINGEGKENYNDHVLFDTKQKYGEKWAAVYNYFN